MALAAAVTFAVATVLLVVVGVCTQIVGPPTEEHTARPFPPPGIDRPARSASHSFAIARLLPASGEGR
ncbi:hypothetical protein GCM10023235_00780 [Kitasatospora terrestris]|uniref:Secreted protein n=1 Tax=Kitasatospora terrestris TaxID=258051 RepID=A0ABP9D5E4_9ACTN